jgi:SAM-dependent methyltransferase
VRYGDVVVELVRSYDAGAAERDTMAKEEWKLRERASFAARVRAAGGRRLLEVGAGTGQDSLYFTEQGLAVVATDLSPAMVERCRAKGLDARVMDFLNLDFPAGSFDAAYALNCLLHVPNADLPAVLAAIRGTLVPGGLLFVGVYGGDGQEGVWEPDQHVPQRFFSWRTDEQIQAFARECFEIVDFHVVDLEGFRFQSLTLRVPREDRPGV